MPIGTQLYIQHICLQPPSVQVEPETEAARRKTWANEEKFAVGLLSPENFFHPSLSLSHTPLETWFWFQWTLTIPYDQGWWEHWFKLYLRWFHCKNLDLYFSTDFKRVLWKYKIIRQMIAFYYIFGFFGTFYDGWSHFCGIKIQFLT